MLFDVIEDAWHQSVFGLGKGLLLVVRRWHFRPFDPVGEHNRKCIICQEPTKTRGKRGITADAALDLAETLGTSPKLWLNLQTTYNLAKHCSWMRRNDVVRQRRFLQ